MIKIGVLALQGALEEHEKNLTKAANNLNLNLKLTRVILPHEIRDIDAIVMPGGESSAMILIGSKNGMLSALRDKLFNGLPALATCAGTILLSKRVLRNQNSPIIEGAFPILDIDILRNGYGRQAESFSTKMEIKNFDNFFHGIFIRAPVIQRIGEDVEILASLKDNPVLIQQDNILATTFHPELTEDTRIHESFLNLVNQTK